MGKPINVAVLTIVCYSKHNKAAGLAVSVCGATVRPKRGSAFEAGAMKQKAPISDVRESRDALVSATSGGCQYYLLRIISSLIN